MNGGDVGYGVLFKEIQIEEVKKEDGPEVSNESNEKSDEKSSEQSNEKSSEQSNEQSNAFYFRRNFQDMHALSSPVNCR